MTLFCKILLTHVLVLIINIILGITTVDSDKLQEILAKSAIVIIISFVIVLLGGLWFLT